MSPAVKSYRESTRLYRQARHREIGGEPGHNARDAGRRPLVLVPLSSETRALGLACLQAWLAMSAEEQAQAVGRAG